MDWPATAQDGLVLGGVAGREVGRKDIGGAFAGDFLFRAQPAAFDEGLVHREVSSEVVFHEEHGVGHMIEQGLGELPAAGAGGAGDCAGFHALVGDSGQDNPSSGARLGTVFPPEFARGQKPRVETRQIRFIPCHIQMKKHWTGVFPAITTQMHQDGSLDLEGTARHAEGLIESGVAGFVFLGSLGENQTLTAEEKRLVMKEMVAHVGGRVPVLSGVAETTPAEAIRYARDCEELGVDGFMLMPAMLYKARRDETLAHFRTVAEATGCRS